MKERDITKLPKWAQIEISRLQRDVKWYKDKLEAGPDNSDTFADPYGRAVRPLGKGPRIAFVGLPGDRQTIIARLDRDTDNEPYLEIRGLNSLQIQPRASNVVHIRTDK